MIRRFIAAILASVSLVTVFSGCSSKKSCDYCGEEKYCKQVETMFGELYACKDCLEDIEEFFE